MPKLEDRLYFKDIRRIPADEPLLIGWHNDDGWRFGIAFRAPSMRDDVVKLTIYQHWNMQYYGTVVKEQPDRSLSDGAGRIYTVWAPNSGEYATIQRWMDRFGLMLKKPDAAVVAEGEADDINTDEK